MTGGQLHNEGGQVTAFVVVFTTALLLVAGLVIDGGAILTTKRQATDIAAQAARAGAQALSVDVLRGTGGQQLDPEQATAAAHAFLDRAGHPGTVTVTGDSVTVTVAIDQALAILGLGRDGQVTVSGQATARNVRGVVEGET